jgi:hypothetical protein
VSVAADFAQGRLTEWYPNADLTAGEGLRWKNIKVLPKARVELPRKARESRYYAARATDAAPLQTTVYKDGKLQTEHERFLFYRGVGSVPTPLSVRALGEGEFLVTNNGKAKIPGFFLVHVQGGQLRFREYGSLDAAAYKAVEMPTGSSSPEKLAAAMERVLTEEGLYEKEARAMVQTWNTAWFGEEGTRFLYLMPAVTTDEVLLLRIEPKPSALVRVMVGRQDVLTPERERDADGLIRRVAESRSEAEQQTLRREVEKKFGRFAATVTEAAEARVVRREQR